MLALVAAILSPAVFALVNYMDKLALQRYETSPVLIACFSGAISLCTAAALWLVLGVHAFPVSVTAAIVLSGFFTELLVLPYYRALQLEETATVIPLFQMVPVLVLAGGFVFLGEHLSTAQYIGCAVTIAAALLIAMERPDGRIFRPRPAFWYMLLASSLGAVATLAFKYGVTVQNFWQVLPYESLGIALCAACILCLPGNLARMRAESALLPRRVYAILSLDEALYLLSRYLLYFALSLLAAGVVSTLAGLQPAFVLLFGLALVRWFPTLIENALDTRTLWLKSGAIGAIIAGTVLIAR